MAQPMSALLSAGASLTPSPVMATISPCDCSARTMRTLCSGVTRANTRQRFTCRASSASSARSSCGPDSTGSSSRQIPTRTATDFAVTAWSPVIMTGVMPACRHCATASADSGRGGSERPTKPRNVRSCSRIVPSCAGRYATASTRSACSARARFCFCSASLRSVCSGMPPSCVRMLRQSVSTRSGAPFVICKQPFSVLCSVDIRLRVLSNGSSAMRGNALRSALRSATSAAARTSAASVGSPDAVRSCRPPGAAALLHSAAYRSTSPVSARSSADRTFVTVMRFCVSVPVLSEQITVAAPSVSTAGSRVRIAPRFAMRCTPSESTTVTIAGSPSGIAATAREIARRKLLSGGTLCRTPSRKITAQIASAPSPSTRPTFLSFCCRGVCGACCSSSIPAMRPICVCIPVSQTTAVPWPVSITVEANSMFRRSALAQSSPHTASASFSQGIASPVSALSCVVTPTAVRSRASAAMRPPADSSRMSPGTTSDASIRISCPSRSTAAWGADSFCSASSAFCARVSCTVPITALSTTMPRMTAQSVKPFSPLRRAVTNDTAAAASRMRIMKSANWDKNRCKTVFGFLPCRTFRPSASRACASGADRPVCAFACSACKTCSFGKLCQCISISHFLFGYGKYIFRNGEGYADTKFP